MSHTIVRETSNEAGEKILRGKSLNSGVGIFNGQSLNSMRKSFVGAPGWWEGENKTQGEEKIERVTEMGCDNVSFSLVSLHRWWVNMRAARRRKAGGESWSAEQEQEVIAKWLQETVCGPEGYWFASWSEKICAGQPLRCLPSKCQVLCKAFPLDSVSQQCTPTRVRCNYPDFNFDLLALLPHAVWPLGPLKKPAPTLHLVVFFNVALLKTTLQSWLMVQDCFCYENFMYFS